MQQLQQQLEEYKAAANQQGTATAAEQQQLQDQLAAKQEELHNEREVMQDLQQQAQSARKELRCIHRTRADLTVCTVLGSFSLLQRIKPVLLAESVSHFCYADSSSTS